MKNSPPKYAAKILRFFLPKRDREFLTGDYEYMFEEVRDRKGRVNAIIWFWSIVLKSIPVYTVNHINWGVGMFANYLKIVLRNIRKQKLYSFITISGLSLGLGVFILFWLITNLTFSADEFHEDADRIYGVVQDIKSNQGEDQKTAITPAPLLQVLENEIPEIEDGVRFYPAGRSVVNAGGDSFYESQILFVESNFLEFFSFKTLLGNPETMLLKKNSVVLAEETATKYFGDENPVGRTITLNNRYELTVSGVVENTPITSSINYKFLIPINTSEKIAGWQNDWKANTQATFILLREGVDSAQLQDRFNSVIEKYYPDFPEAPKRIWILPLTDFLSGTMGIRTFLDKNYMIANYLLLASAVILLVIVSLNFMSLATARYSTRAKEVGVRKVIGAARGSLISQFLGESIILSLLSLPLAILVYEAGFTLLAGEWWTARYISLYDDPSKLLIMTGVTVMVGFFSGCYPAFFLSSFRPVAVLNGIKVSGKKGARFRKILVVLQFSMSIVVIIFAAVVNKQFNHILNVDFGYSRGDVLSISINDEARGRLNILKRSLESQPEILLTSSSRSLPTQWNPETQVVPQGYSTEESFTVNNYSVDYNFIELLQMEIVAGRAFAEEYGDEGNFIINETAVDRFMWENPIGKEISMGDRNGRVVGVVKDFLFKDMHVPISPSVFYMDKESVGRLLVKKNSGVETAAAAVLIEKIWKEHLPGLPFEYITLDQYFYDIYYGFNTIGIISGVIGVIGIFLSCLGMLALATFAVEKRRKEIGVRKVLGASSGNLVKMLLYDFLKFVVISNVIGITISYYVSNKFLEWVSTYRVELGIKIIAFTFIGSLLVAFVSVVWQTTRAASANPVESLKYE